MQLTNPIDHHPDSSSLFHMSDKLNFCSLLSSLAIIYPISPIFELVTARRCAKWTFTFTYLNLLRQFNLCTSVPSLFVMCIFRLTITIPCGYGLIASRAGNIYISQDKDIGVCDVYELPLSWRALDSELLE